MAHGPKPPEQAPGAPLWMVSFTDSMTNLLTFFILLITFSAFGQIPGGPTQGVGPRNAGPTVCQIGPPPETSLFPQIKDPALQPPEGSEKPNPQEELPKVPRPRAPIGILDTDAYRDRKIIRLPSKLLFYGWGKFITEAGQTRLAEIAPLLRAAPCQVVVSESSCLHPNHPLFQRQNLGPERAWAVVQYFTEKGNLSADRFTVSATPSVTSDQYNEEPVVEIVLLVRRVYP